MIDLLIITLITGAILYFSLRVKSHPIEVTPPKATVMEDSSLLKEQLAELQVNYSSALKQLGTIQSQFEFMRSADNKKSEIIEALQADKIKQKQDFDKLLGQKKSSEVRTGAIGESLLPLHEDFPCNPKTLRLLGSPIDYVSFCYDTNMITFVEVKTGESQLNLNQKKVKKMIEEGRVQFKIVRLNEKGVTVK